MRARLVRFLLAATLLAAGGGAGFWASTLARHIDESERTSRENIASIDRLETRLDELADEELTYAASGRFDQSTLERTSSAMRDIASETPLLLSRLTAAEAPSAHAAVADASAAMTALDSSVRDNLRGGLDLMAADLVFTETRETRRTMRQQLRVLRTAEAAAVSEARFLDLTQAAGAFAVAMLLCTWALIRASRHPHIPVAAAPSTPAADSRGSPASIDQGAVAELCTAVGRLKSKEDLQGLLERAGTLLDASGVVVWMAAGEELIPAAAHGYDLERLGRFGSIGPGSVNATAAAWRTGRLQTVAGESTSRGAIVAPMLGPDRCIGALAIELSPGRESDVSTQAAATLIAAQLSAVVAPWPAGSSAPADVLPFERAAGASV